MDIKNIKSSHLVNWPHAVHEKAQKYKPTVYLCGKKLHRFVFAIEISTVNRVPIQWVK